MRTEWKVVLSASIDATGERQNRCRNRIRRFHRVVQINGWIIHRWTVPLPSLKRHSCPCFVPRWSHSDRQVDKTRDYWSKYDVRSMTCGMFTLTTGLYLLYTEGKFYEPHGMVNTYLCDFRTIGCNVIVSLFLWKLFTQYYSIILFQ